MLYDMGGKTDTVSGICPACGGNGYIYTHGNTEARTVLCFRCGGSGEVRAEVRVQDAPAPSIETALRDRIISTATAVFSREETTNKLLEHMCRLALALSEDAKGVAATNNITTETANVRILLERVEREHNCRAETAARYNKRLRQLGREVNVIPDEREDMAE